MRTINPQIRKLWQRAEAMGKRWRAKPHSADRVNRAMGRAERIITLHCARLGERVPLLYVSEERGALWLTTWPGTRVARLTVTGKAPAFNCELTCYSATICGRNYYGRSHGPGMYINLRAGKLVRPC